MFVVNFVFIVTHPFDFIEIIFFIKITGFTFDKQIIVDAIFAIVVVVIDIITIW